MNKLKADQEGRIRLRCHFSIIIESVWQFWLVILIFLFNQIDEVLDFIRSLDDGTLREFMAGGGLIGLLAILALTLLVFLWQFLRWRKTLITLDGNLIIIERNTLNKKKSTIAIENVSAVNMERNLFERIVGTYRLKLDTNSMTTANKTDVSIVLREDVALAFRQLIIARMNILKGGQGQMAEERQPDKLTQAAREGIRVLHCGKLTAGEARNVVASSALAECTYRFFDPEHREALLRELQALAADAGPEIRTEVRVRVVYPPVINDAGAVERAEKLLRLPEIMDPLFTAEDFAFYLRERPGCLIWLGVAEGEPGRLHTPTLFFDERPLLDGLLFFVKLATQTKS